MNAKHIKIQILSLMTLTIILGTLPSLSSANVLTSLSSLEPERLGEGFVSTIALNVNLQTQLQSFSGIHTHVSRLVNCR